MLQKYKKIIIASFIMAMSVIGTTALAPQVNAAPTCSTDTVNCNNSDNEQDDYRTGVKCEDTNEAGDCAEKTTFSFGSCGTKSVGIRCLVVEVLRFASIAVGIAVVAGITIGGITYSLGRGNPGQVQKGVTIITNSIVGLLLYLLMFGLINFLVPGGVIQ